MIFLVAIVVAGWATSPYLTAPYIKAHPDVFPGSLPERVYEPEEVFMTMTMSEALFRASIGFYGLAVLLSLWVICTMVMIMAPFWWFILLTFYFGPVSTISWTVIAIWAVLVGTTAFVTAMSPLVRPLASSLVNFALEHEFVADTVVRQANASMFANGRRLAPESRPGGMEWDALSTLADHNLPECFGILLSHSYVPSFSSQGLHWVVAAYFAFIWFTKKGFRSVVLWFRGTLMFAHLALVLVILSMNSSIATLSTVERALGWVLTIIVVIIGQSLNILWHYLFGGKAPSVLVIFRLVQLKVMTRALRYSLKWELLTLAPKKRRRAGVFVTGTKWQALWNNALMDLAFAVDKIALPNFIRELPSRFDAEGINATQEILASLGWPSSDNVLSDALVDAPANISAFREALLGTVPSIKQGVVSLSLSVADELKLLALEAPTYKRTEQYGTIENELESISRYFVGDEIDLPELPVEEVFELVGSIFADSRLVPFNYIIKKWEKTYGLGPFWRDPDGRKWRKLSRKKFIASIGGMGNMVKLWAKTFEVAPTLVPVSGVSIKSEALPEKKWAKDAVRTIVSSPIVHYIMSTIWNLEPNHRFRYWNTNIKVGMPLNGAALGLLISEHSFFDKHFAGDFSAFDSTVKGKVVEIIAKVRKKGFERHRDYAKICFLIDANYSSLLKAPLLTTSTGNIYRKGTGLSTGHSSTSMDNSLAVTIYYLIAWRELTGLSAHEFRYYNKLSNYGDDHLLSYRSTAPAAWTMENVQKCLGRFGVVLRDEEPSRDLMQMEFLSKKWRRPTADDKNDLINAGLKVPEFIVYHNPLKLIGKATAPSKDVKEDRRYRVKRLISYLDLCAGQPETYNKLRTAIDQVLNRPPRLRVQQHIPEYAEVIRKWHNPDSVVSDPDEPDTDESGVQAQIMDYTQSLGLDTLVHLVSLIPDVVNPAIYNMGYTNYLIRLFGHSVAWPCELIRRTNKVTGPSTLHSLVKMTCYDFLADNAELLTTDVSAQSPSLLLRNWLYIAFKPPKITPPGLAVLGYVDKQVAKANFVLNGYVQTVTRRYDLPILDLLLIALLSTVQCPLALTPIMSVQFMAFSDLYEKCVDVFMKTLWSRVPPNMKESDQALNALKNDIHSVTVVAPTGTGKSTTFVNYVWRFHSVDFQRVILVVPRRMLVISLVPYLRSAFNLPVEMVTEGFAFASHFKFFVTTPQEVLLHESWLVENNLFLVDEAHVLEPAMLALQHILAKTLAKRVLLTATPSADNLADSDMVVNLKLANTWVIVDSHSATWRPPEGQPATYSRCFWGPYRSHIIECVRSFKDVKFLVFVVDLHQADNLAEVLPQKCCVISSRSKAIDPDAQVFIATAVADVGITLPNVSWVITSNITRAMVPSQLGGQVKLLYIDDALTKQRRGRTGRTNNGLFTLFKFSGLSDISVPDKWSKDQVGIEMLLAGAPAALTARYFPGAITSMTGKEYTRELDPLVDQFAQAFQVLQHSFREQEQRTGPAAVAGQPMGDHMIVEGNRLQFARVMKGGDPENPQHAQPVDTRSFNQIVSAVAMQHVIEGTEAVSKHFVAALRTQMFDFKQIWAAIQRYDKNPRNADSDLARKGDPSGRYGTRIASKAIKHSFLTDSVFDSEPATSIEIDIMP